MTVLWLLAFALVLIGGLAAFVTLELVALARKDDDLHTLSTYLKRARRRTGVAGSLVLSVLILVPALWLFGHLVKEWW